MTYYLPRLGRVRAAAFADDPETESYLRNFLGTPDLPKNKTWSDLLADPYLSGVLARGEGVNPDVRKISGTFVLPESGTAEIEFALAPKTLLFVIGPYAYVEDRNTFAYSSVEPYVFRLPINALAYSPDSFGLSGVYEALASIERTAATHEDTRALDATLDTLRIQLEQFKARRDPLAAVLPALAAEAQKSKEKADDLQRQIEALQVPEGVGVPFPVDYPTRGQIDLLLSRKVDAGLVEAYVASKTSQAEFDTHILARNPHSTGYQDVGATARTEFFSLLTRFNALLTRVDKELSRRVTSLVGLGDITTLDKGGGEWEIDGSLIGENGTPGPPRLVEHRLAEPSLKSGTISSKRLYAMSAGRIAGAVVSVWPVSGSIGFTLSAGGRAVYETTVSDGVAELLAPEAPLHLVERGDLIEATFSRLEGVPPEDIPDPDVLLQLRIEES